MDKEDSQEFIERKKLIALDRENIELKHNFKMKELEYQRESDRMFHERELERGRIKSAEIRKMQERKANFKFMNTYQNE